MSKSKRSSKSSGPISVPRNLQSRGVLIICIVFAVVGGLWASAEFWPGPTLETEGWVVGHGCADRNQSRSLQDCQIKYSVVAFRDAHGQRHEFHTPEDDLKGTVPVRYRFIALPGDITLGVSVDRDDPRWVRGSVGAIISLFSLIMAGLVLRNPRPKKSKGAEKT